MQLTQFTDYGLRVLMYLARQDRAEMITINEISDQFDIPRNHLVKIVNRLVKLSWVSATRGRNGGLKLASVSDELTLGLIIRQLENHYEIVDCEKTSCCLNGHCHLKYLFDQGIEQFFSYMDKYSLSDAVNAETSGMIEQMHTAYVQVPRK